ncbi:MAG: hypothetical protein ACRC7W_04760 [Fusobacteriaceae bacterium]
MIKDNKEVLNILENVKLFFTTHEGFDRALMYQKRHGLCWHITANTAHQTIWYPDLYDIFISLGYDKSYPIESQICEGSPSTLYLNTPDLYDPETEQGKLRLKLLDEMIEYFKK